MDGLIYNNVAINLAEGEGGMWHLTHSPSLFADFAEHPPLAIWLMSVFYSFFGKSWLVASAYNLLVFILTCLLIVFLWRSMGYGWANGWLPLLLWLLVPAVTQNACDGMLECTMALFVLGAAVCFVRCDGDSWRDVVRATTAGVLLLGAFLCKGFTGLYVLVLPFVMWLGYRLLPDGKTQGFGRMACVTVVALAVMLFGYAVMWLAMPGMGDYMARYISHQVMGGIANVQVERWYIVGKFFQNVAIVLCICVLGVALLAKKGCVNGRGIGVSRDDWRNFMVYMLLALCGVLPIMISLKQRGFYILTVYPFVALAAGAVVRNVDFTKAEKTGTVVMWFVALISLAAAVAFNVKNFGKPQRNAVMLDDMTLIAAQLDRGERVGMPYDMRTEYSLVGYYYRAKRIDLMPLARVGEEENLPTHLISDGRDMTEFDAFYREINLNTKQYKLFLLK